MIWFLLIFLGVYGSMQFFIFWALHRAFPGMGRWMILPVVWLLLMLLAPAAVRWFDRSGWLWPARLAAATGHVWIAVSFWFIAAAGTAELLNLAFRAAGAKSPLPPRLLVPGLGALIAVLIVWGLIEASRPRVERLELAAPQLPAGSRPLVIVQISDLHLGVLGGDGTLRRTAAAVERLRPDLVVLTGDLLDTTGPQAALWMDGLAALHPPLGKFAVTGNHEIYAGAEASVKLMERAGFRVLRAEAAEPAPGLRLVGVDDPGLRLKGAADEGSLLPPAEARDRFTVLLKHRPEVAPGSAGRFDLQLSGHTHRGQIFPFVAVVALFNSHVSGNFDVGGGSKLHVSRGSGTWGPPLRFLSPPEITVIELRPAAAAAPDAAAGR